MPIIAVPANVTKEVFETSPVAITTEEKPMITYVDKTAITSKARSYTLVTSQTAYLKFVFQDEAGNHLDLTGVKAARFKAILSESVTGGKIGEPIVTVEEPFTSGLLSILLDEPLTRVAGIYNLVVQLYNEAKTELIKEDHALVYIANSAMGPRIGPPSLLEIRLQLRDSSPEENSLLDGLTFTDEEMAMAAIRPIQYFNESDPDVGIYFNTSNFPSRYHWIEGIIAQLFRILEEYNRKNHLAYNSGGLSVDDRNREQNYAQAAERHWQVFLDWVKRKKVKINMANGYAVVNSYYAYRY